ncbi:D-alanyl-D-alanine carboxypeptidase family protein [Williamsia sp. DF01-3]|uniref:D-alanyl-D-alanine carboxypeptidase family protein n=1 Tax=Williamsia sp. DF01-3 TaxID=2934157 RepID=UPI001FF133E1|nr:serine hydrolase [Williamsia sp. DF01-3]MCK0518148.1 serine hydrolase [Williamsia sp. DF01-3]
MIRPMVRAAAMATVVLLAPGSIGLGAATAAPIQGTPTAGAPAPETITDTCPYKTLPIPPVDESEVVPPGSSSPAPLPVPSPPVGGEALGGCGVVTAPGAAPPPAGLTAAGWLIADLTADKVLAAKDPHGRYRPASTIKVLLILVVLDELDLDDTVTGTQEDDEVEGDAAGVGPGGVYTVRELVAGLMMVSGNDCANALARALGGPQETVDKMNAKARELGALDTRAASASGLDGPGMSSSPYDEALIFAEALENDDFVEISQQTQMRFPGYPGMPTPTPTDQSVDGAVTETTTQSTPAGDPGIDLYNMNQLLYDYPGTVAGKTGYTDDARKTFVGAAERDGRTILVVQMYGLNDSYGSFWRQAEAMLDYGFAQSSDLFVGSLTDDPASPSSVEYSGGTDEDDAARSPSVQDSGRSSWTARITIGLVGALVVIGLVYAGTRVNRRR